MLDGIFASLYSTSVTVPVFLTVCLLSVALGFGIWCFFLTAACCLLGMYKQGDLYTTLLNVITPVVLVALGLILPAIKKREGKVF